METLIMIAMMLALAKRPASSPWTNFGRFDDRAFCGE